MGVVPATDAGGGGIYQYSMTVLRALEAWQGEDTTRQITLFADGSPGQPALASARKRNWTVMPLPKAGPESVPQVVGRLRQIAGEGLPRQAWRVLRRGLTAARYGNRPREERPELDAVRANPVLGDWLRRQGIDLMLYPAPITMAFECGVPYIMAIHDLQHRLQPEFPEFSANNQWEYREYLFRNGARYSTSLLADSEVGKEDILHYYSRYGVTAAQVKVLPFLPASYLSVEVSAGERQRVRETYHLPERFLFYPAQFWPHKNHLNIVEALGRLRSNQNLVIPIVFCGSYGDAQREKIFRQVMRRAEELKIRDQILYLGFVPNSDMSGLYAEAEALVMPTFCGPTNIPVLEAWAFGCPVLTSDIRGIQEQTGDAAALAAPDSPEAIAQQIARLWTDEPFRRGMAERGRRRLASYTQQDFDQRVTEIVQEAAHRIQQRTE